MTSKRRQWTDKGPSGLRRDFADCCWWYCCLLHHCCCDASAGAVAWTRGSGPSPAVSCRDTQDPVSLSMIPLLLGSTPSPPYWRTSVVFQCLGFFRHWISNEPLEKRYSRTFFSPTSPPLLRLFPHERHGHCLMSMMMMIAERLTRDGFIVLYKN